MNEYMEMIIIASPILMLGVIVAWLAYRITKKPVSLGEKYLSGLTLAVTHLNASYVAKVSSKQLALALRHGTVHHNEIPEPAGAIITSLFTACTPNLIMQCIDEAGASLESVQALYHESIKDWHRSPGWEAAVRNYSLRNPLEKLKGSVDCYHRPFDSADD